MPAPHALIVEDELVVALYLQDLLSRHGYVSFSFAAAAAQAIEQFRLHQPDLVTIDFGLMHGDGLEAARELRAIRGNVPIVYVTGSPDAVQKDLRAVVLEKPITPRDLAEALDLLNADRSPRRNDGQAPAATVI